MENYNLYKTINNKPICDINENYNDIYSILLIIYKQCN